jgi:hypothetical protein
MQVNLSNLTIATLGTEVLDLAYETAEPACPRWARTKGDWVRLARVKGSAKKPYVIAIRRVATRRGFQFSCGCPQGKFRCNTVRGAEHRLCKHQRAFLQDALGLSPKIQFYQAGLQFVREVAASLGLPEEAEIFHHTETIHEEAA